MEGKKSSSIKLFEDKIVRSIWDDTLEKWFFSVKDVVQILTDSKNVTDYIKKLRIRDNELSKGWGQIVTPLPIKIECLPRLVNLHLARIWYIIIHIGVWHSW